MKLPSELLSYYSCGTYTLDDMNAVKESERALIKERDEALKERNALLERAESAEAKALANANVWIPVSERLPEEGQRVLALWLDRRPHVVTFEVLKDGNLPVFRLDSTQYNSTYGVHNFSKWMPLPPSE